MSTILIGILKSLLTEAFVKRVLLGLAEWLATKTDNTLDDEMVAALKEALK